MLRRYALVKFLENLRDSDEFPALSWPLHLTIVPNFSIGWDDVTLREKVHGVLAGHDPVDVGAGHDDLFGPQRTVPVTVLEPTPGLMSLHNRIFELLTNAGADFCRPEYVQRGYRPHVTITPQRRLGPGDRIVVDAISLVDLQPRGNSQLRRVLGTISLVSTSCRLGVDGRVGNDPPPGEVPDA